MTNENRAFIHDLIQEFPESTYTPFIIFSPDRNYSALSTLQETETKEYQKKAKRMFRKTLDFIDNQLFEEFTRERVKTLKEGGTRAI